MQYSFSSVYMAIIASNVLLVLLTLSFRNKKIMVNAGHKILLFFVYCTLLRFLFPFELPISRNVLLPESVSFVVSWARHPLLKTSSFSFSIWTLMMIIWLIGFLIQLVKHLKSREVCNYNILSSALDFTDREPYHSLVEDICRKKGKRNCFEVLEVSGITVPMLYGVFSPKILIPTNWNVSQEHLRYALTHEIAHHFHHDLVTKNIINIFAMIYWWNPFSHLLVKQTDTILEMRVDDTITKSDRETITGYLYCLIEIAEQAAETNQKLIPDTLSVSLSDNTSELTKRFEMLMGAGEKKHHSWNIALVVLTFVIYVLSYAYTFEAHYMPDETLAEIIEQTDDNIHAIQNNDGTYDIYFGTLFVENVDSLEYYPGIPIYTEEKENNNEEY